MKTAVKKTTRVKAKTKAKVKTSIARSEPARDATREIWRLQVALVHGMYAKGPWEATIDVTQSTTLQALHRSINKAIGFQDDHLHTFYVGRQIFGRDRIRLENGDGEVLHDLTLGEIFPLGAGQKLFYWFDFGDDWMFSITCAREAASPPAKGARYPRVIGTKGRKPEQYPDPDEEE